MKNDAHELLCGLAKSLQRRYGSKPSITLEDVIENPCGIRHKLILQGSEWEEGYEGILLRETAEEFRQTVYRYLADANIGYVPGLTMFNSCIQIRCDGTINGIPVNIDITGSESPTGRDATLATATKAHLLGEDSAIHIHVDRNSQHWSFWSLTWSNSDDVGRVISDMAYIGKLLSGEAIPVGMASGSDCVKCPVRESCDIDPVDRPGIRRNTTIRAECMDSLLVKVDAHLQSLNRKDNGRRRGVIHPSEISTSGCDRKIAYGLLRTDQREDVGPHLRRIFDFGHALHEVVQRALAGQFPEFRSETEVDYPALRIYGHCDGEVGPMGLEIKSISEKGFESLSSPKKEHTKQTTIYSRVRELTHMNYLYVCKGTGEVAAFTSKFDIGVWLPIKRRAQDILDTVARGELPSGSASGYECSRCKYEWTCEDSKAYSLKGRESRRFKKW